MTDLIYVMTARCCAYHNAVIRHPHLHLCLQPSHPGFPDPSMDNQVAAGMVGELEQLAKQAVQPTMKMPCTVLCSTIGGGAALPQDLNMM